MLQCNVHLPSSWTSLSSTSSAAPSINVHAAGNSILLQMHNSSRRKKRKRLVQQQDDEKEEEMQQQRLKVARSKPFSSKYFETKKSGHNATSSCSTAGAVKDLASHTQPQTGPPQSARDACENILAAIQRCNVVAERQPPSSVACDAKINLDHILSRVPYREMLKDLFGSNAGYKAPDIPVVTKAYEESFMRQPMFEHERPCIMGTQCECNFVSTISGEGFIGVEFTLPSDPDGSSKRQMCVLCHRKLVQKLFYDIIYTGSPYRGIIQRYGNICNHENEYAREVCLICPPNGPVECMPFPSASHQRNKYSVVQRNGIKYIRQHFMGMQDFRQAPPSSAAP